MIHSVSYSFVNKQNNTIILTNNFNFNNNKGTICAFQAKNPTKIIGEIEYFIYDTNKLFLSTIHVINEYKKCSVGSAMVYALELFAKNHNINIIYAYMNNILTSIDSLQDIKARTEFYKALNFEITKETQQIYSLIKTRDKFFTNKKSAKINLIPIQSNIKK